MTYLSREELLEAVGEEPIVEDENDEVQIAMVLQHRKFVDIINNLPTYVLKLYRMGKIMYTTRYMRIKNLLD